jgi:hypothetical protein
VTVELLDLVSNAESDNMSKLVSRLLGLLDISLSHPAALRDQVHNHAKVWEYD